MQIDDLMTVLVTPHCDGLILRQGQLSAEIPKPFLRFSPDWTLVRAAASVTLGSLPPFAASSSKVSFGPFVIMALPLARGGGSLMGWMALAPTSVAMRYTAGVDICM